MTNPHDSYRTRLGEYTVQEADLQRQVNFISNLRLVVVVAGLMGGIFAYRVHSVEMMVTAGIATVVLFIILATHHANLFDRLGRVRAMAAINRRGIDRCESRWGGFVDSGAEFADTAHSYSSDLDIFGKNSLFQYISCAQTFFGRKRLAEILRKGERAAGVILSRQEAVGELAGQIDWRQTLECAGAVESAGNDPRPIIDWAEGGVNFFRRKWLTGVVLILPLITGVVAAVSYFGTKSLLPVYPFLALQILLVAITTRGVHRLFGTFDKYGRALGAFGSMIDHIERREFTGAALTVLRREIAGTGVSGGARRALRQLSSTVAATEVRFSPIPWFLANLFLLWDLRCAIRFDRWKLRHGNDIRRWLTCIAELETLASFALLKHDHPSWVFPVVADDGGMLGISMQGAGHPLLDERQSVTNDFELGPPGGSVGIITGSNMSGKSTFLRTVGCNLVLALAGAPVCARRFECRPLRLYTSMRGVDDLMSHTSTFYAELLRVKMIVDAAVDHLPLVFLLDELFRGTNSSDRHDGAVTLLSELSRTHTLGLVSTHDLDLCSLALTSELFKNYHFEERFDEGELHFDYLLKAGPSTTRNAIYLMRMVGIGVQKKGEC